MNTKSSDAYKDDRRCHHFICLYIFDRAMGRHARSEPIRSKPSAKAAPRAMARPAVIGKGTIVDGFCRCDVERCTAGRGCRLYTA